MHQTRQKASKKLPIPRKGTKYVVRASSQIQNSVPVLIALRDMLKLAKNKKEVKSLINKKIIKINSRLIKDPRESVKIFNILEAGKKYVLTMLPTHKFSFNETSDSTHISKVIGKKILRGSKIQLNLHDGSNILSSDKKISVHDSLQLDSSNKISNHIPFSKAKSVFVIKGKYSGQEAKLSERKENSVFLKFKDKEDTVELSIKQVIAQ
jgi:small subunit ribosomal protein S4e